MRANRSTETSIEVAVQKALWASGIRGYRKNVKSPPCKPDFVFRRQKLVIDIRGCFWHQCPICTGKVPNVVPHIRIAPKPNCSVT
jgi:DNA mismatch endonuclease (patch repair protein)